MQEMQDVPRPAGSLLTAQQVQDLLGVDASTVYRMAADGRLPAVKVGRQWRFRADRISALLDEGASPVRDAEVLPLHPATTAGRATATDPATAARSSSEAAPARPTTRTDGTTAPALRTDIAQPVVDSAADLLGVMMVVTDMQGRPVTHVANPCLRFVEHADDPDVVTACAEEWRELAEDLDFEPRFAAGHLGFECARAFLRSGSQLVGMVLVGGVAPQGTDEATDPDLYHLDPQRRTDVLAALRKVAVTLSRAATTDGANIPDPRGGSLAAIEPTEGATR